MRHVSYLLLTCFLTYSTFVTTNMFYTLSVRIGFKICTVSWRQTQPVTNDRNAQRHMDVVSPLGKYGFDKAFQY